MKDVRAGAGASGACHGSLLWRLACKQWSIVTIQELDKGRARHMFKLTAWLAPDVRIIFSIRTGRRLIRCTPNRLSQFVAQASYDGPRGLLRCQIAVA
jgi:hypothetical protein